MMSVAAGPADQLRAIRVTLHCVRQHIREERGPVRGMQRYLRNLERALEQVQLAGSGR